MPLSAGFIHILVRRKECFVDQKRLFSWIFLEIPATKTNDYEPKPLVALREVPSISEEEQEDSIAPLHRSNYSLDFRHSDEDLTRSSIEPNIKGLVDNCVRSSLHDLSLVQRESDSKPIVTLLHYFYLFRLNST